jgi:Na+-transporting methylmalonyl-CoA/oxaloacetate decarboxylase gamma subunit
MDNPIIISLVVSGIGMLMLFLALTLLYGLMYLMTWMTNERPPVTDQSEVTEKVEEQDARHRMQRAAAVAVALARAEQDTSHIHTTKTKETTSAWRAFHHQRQMAHNTPARRTQ